MARRYQIDSSTKFFVAVIGITVIAIVLKELSQIFIPFVIAYFLYFLFSPLNTFLQKKKIPSFAVVILDIVIIVLIIWGTSSFIIGSVIRFGKQVPEYFDKLNAIVSGIAVSLKIKATFFRDFSIQKLISGIDYQHLAGGIFSSTVPLIGSALFILFFFIFVFSGHRMFYEAIKNRYVLKKVKPELKKIKKKYRASLEDPNTDYNQVLNDKLNTERQEKEAKLANTFKAITEQIQRYIIIKISDNLAAGIVVTIFLAILGIDFPIIWGLFVFLLNFIPSIGSAIALILPVIMALLQTGSLTFALVVLVVIAAIQTLFFNLIETSLLGRRLNLNPMLILMAVLIWGYIWGIMGMLFAVPLTAIIKIIISNSDSQNLNFLSDLMSKE